MKPTLLPKRAFTIILLLATTTAALAQGSLNFDGADDFATIPTGITSTITGDFTAEAWVYWRGAPYSHWQRVFDFGDNITDNMFLTPAAGGTDHPRFAITINGAGNEQIINAGAPLSLNVWHHIAITINASTNTGTMYIDGAVAGTNTSITLRPSSLGATTHNYLGKSQYADPYFNGYIEEFRISNTLRYTGPFTPTRTHHFTTDGATVALYHLQEGIGQTLHDETGNHSAFRGATTSVDAADPTWESSVLAARLFSLTAAPVQTGVLLKWSANEVANSERFFIERSKNGFVFEQVAAVPVTNAVSYSFVDNSVSDGTWFYRVSHTAANGASTKTDVVKVDVGLTASKLLWLTKGDGTAAVHLVGGANEAYTLTNVGGRVVRKGNLVNGAVSISQVGKNGIYVISVVQRDRVLTKMVSF